MISGSVAAFSFGGLFERVNKIYGGFIGLDENVEGSKKNSLTCNPQYILGSDNLCHSECGSSGTYCTGDSRCFNGKCLSCSSGYYLGTDGRCHSNIRCNAGYILGNDDRCHRECGNSGTYCTGNSQCYNGRCLSCNSGYYLGTDGRCYQY